jgi:asparagine synthase (glutamine-hydrolysing)
MCGICGLIDYKTPVTNSIVQGMMKAMTHRGPDDNGVEIFVKPNFSVGLGHVRLSIIDLSELGHQPMNYEDLTIVYNGEVYNYKEIRAELEKVGHRFVSNTDTEVVLHSFAEWGMECVERFIGMFAFAIYSSKENTLYCCRDRAGVKPFFYYIDEKRFVFGSELKCLLSLSDVDKTIDEESLAYFIQLGYIPMDKCILQQGKKLEAGHWLVYDVMTRKMSLKKYWDIDDFYNRPKLNIGYLDAKEKLRELFVSSFGYRMISDVPVGIFLSGGFDSSLVTAILSKELGIIPKTFTIGFHHGQNEAPDAEEISKFLNTEHQTYYCETEDLKNIIPTLPFYYDEPCSDISAIPTILVSKLSRQKVKVALSADGGDEIFAGYYTYEYISKYYNTLNLFPKFVGRLAGVPYNMLSMIVPQKRSVFQWMLDTITGYYKGEDYTVKGLLTNTLNWESNQYKMIRKNPLYSCSLYFDYIKTHSNNAEYVMALNFKENMRELLCTKVDRASMASSLEVREPMLDHRIAEFGAQLPLEYKLKGNIKKRILKEIVYDYIPKKIMDKPKRGFYIPLGQWLRTDLKDYVYDNLNKTGLEETEFESGYVLNMLDNYMNKGYHYGYMFRGYSDLIWRILQYQLWYNMWIKR